MSENCTHNCETCGENCASRKTNPADFREPPHALSSIKKVIGVVSGKGGVGKSMTSGISAAAAICSCKQFRNLFTPFVLLYAKGFCSDAEQAAEHQAHSAQNNDWKYDTQ